TSTRPRPCSRSCRRRRCRSRAARARSSATSSPSACSACRRTTPDRRARMILALQRRTAAWRRSTREVIVEMWHEFRADRVSGLAAEIAFFGALSVFPALLVVASALGLLGEWFGEGVAIDVEDAILDRLGSVLGPDSGL